MTFRKLPKVIDNNNKNNKYYNELDNYISEVPFDEVRTYLLPPTYRQCPLVPCPLSQENPDIIGLYYNFIIDLL